jgi:maltose-binding protein MalE
MKHRISVILICALLLPLLAACSEKPGQTTETAAPAPSAVTGGTEQEDEARAYPYDAGQDFGGKNFHFINAPKDYWDMFTTVAAEEMNGEVINDAVYERNARIGDKYNCSLSEEGFTISSGDLWNEISPLMMAGDPKYDILCLPYRYTAASVTSGYILNLDELKSLHLDESYWNQTILRATSLNNLHYIASSAAHFMSVDGMWCIYFNQAIMRNLQLDFPYDLVREGKWTLDKLIEYMKAGASLNGDSAFAPPYDGRAQWNSTGSSVVGFTSYTSVFQKMLYGMEAHMIDKDDNDQMVFAASSEHFITCATKLAENFSVPGLYLNANDDDGFSYNLNIFPSGRALFLGGELKDAQVFRDMDDEFGVVPLPKYDENQEQYFTTLDYQMITFAIPYTQANPEDAAFLLDVMSFETDEKILDLFLGNRIEQKGLRNEDSVEMLHIIYEGLGIDLGEAFDLFGTVASDIKDNIPQGKTEFASLIEKNKKPITKQMTKLQENFQ